MKNDVAQHNMKSAVSYPILFAYYRVSKCKKAVDDNHSLLEKLCRLIQFLKTTKTQPKLWIYVLQDKIYLSIYSVTLIFIDRAGHEWYITFIYIQTICNRSGRFLPLIQHSPSLKMDWAGMDCVWGRIRSKPLPLVITQLNALLQIQ